MTSPLVSSVVDMTGEKGVLRGPWCEGLLFVCSGEDGQAGRQAGQKQIRGLGFFGWNASKGRSQGRIEWDLRRGGCP